MKRNALRAALVAGILFVLYIAIAFLIPFERNEVFWVSLLFTAVAVAVGLLALYQGMFKREDAKSKFYGFSVVRVGLIYVVIQAALSLVFMALAPWIWLWLVAVICLLLFGAATMGLISVEAVVEEIQQQDEKMKRNVAVMRGLQSKVNRLAALCEDPELQTKVQALAEELRYSDPVSSEVPSIQSDSNTTVYDELQTEANLAAAIEDLQQAVIDADNMAASALCRKATALLAERNRLCKLNKG